MEKSPVGIAQILNQREAEILTDWIGLQLGSTNRRTDLINDADLQRQSKEFLTAFRQALNSGNQDTMSTAWKEVRHLLEDMAAARARQGFSPSDTAIFVFSLKQPLFRAMQSAGPDGAAELWNVTNLLDRLGLISTEVHQ